MSAAPSRAASAVSSSGIVWLSRSAATRGQVVRDLAFAAARRPAEHRRHQVGDLLGRVGAAVEGLDRDPGAPAQHVVQVQRALVGGARSTTSARR